MVRHGLVVSLCLGSPSAGAQSVIGVPAVDSASAARLALMRASSSLQSGDTAGARRELERARTAWPTQESYIWYSAVLAARVGDTTAALRALGSYADLGLGRDLRGNAAFARINDAPGFDVLVRRHEVARAPVVNSTRYATIPDTLFWAEGLDVDRTSGHVFVTSVRQRTIVELDASGRRLRDVLPPREPGIGAIFAVRVGPRGDVLYASMGAVPQMNGYQPADTALAALLEIGRSDGRVRRRWDLPVVAGGHTLGDVAIGPAGDVFTSDSNQPFLYRLRPGADTLERLSSPLFMSLQGIATTPDPNVLYVADYSIGLLRVDLRSGDVVRVSDAPRSTSLGCDGLVWHDGSIIAVQNGVEPARIMRFHLDATGHAITRADVIDRNVSLATEPTIGTIVNGSFYYVANSQWQLYDAAGRRLPMRHAEPLQILRLRLP